MSSANLFIAFYVVLLAAPVCLLVGVGAGALITWRIMRGIPPVKVPSFRAAASPIVGDPRAEAERKHQLKEAAAKLPGVNA